MKNILFYFVFLIALGACKSEIAEPESSDKAKVLFKFNSKEHKAAKLATTVTRPKVDNMYYAVYAYEKETKAFAGSVDIDDGDESNIHMTLNPNKEYIFIAVSNNQPIEITASNVIFRSTYLHKILQRPGYNDLENFVIDKVRTKVVGTDISQDDGYANKLITYYGREDDFGQLSSNALNIVQFDMALVNFVLDVDLDMTDFGNTQFLVNGNTVSLISDYAINYKNGWFHLLNGTMSGSDTDQLVLNNNFINATHINTFTGNNQITLSTYLTEEDEEGELYMHIYGWTNEGNEIRIPNLHFKPGHRAKLKLKVKRGTGVDLNFSFSIKYDKGDDIEVQL